MRRLEDPAQIVKDAQVSDTQDTQTPEQTPRWRDVWQVPALVMAVVLLAGALYTAVLSSPAPNYQKFLSDAERLIEHEQCEQALDVLNDRLLPYVDRKGFKPEYRRKFHVLRARGVYLAQSLMGLDQQVNDENIVKEYLKAENLHADLEPRDIEYLADTYIVLGQEDKAMKRIRSLERTDKPRRNKLLKRLIERKLAERTLDYPGTIERIADFLADPDLTMSDRVWAIARQTELRLAMGFNEDAIAVLLRELPGLTDADPAQLGELYADLGRAYLETGATAEATRWLQHAQKLIPAMDERRGDVLVMLGRISDLGGRRDEARALYTSVIEQYSSPATLLPALLGLGEVEASEGDDEASLAAYRRLTELLPEAGFVRSLTREDVSSSLMARFRERLDADQTEAALRYASLAESLFNIDEMPLNVLKGLGEGHAKYAMELLGETAAGGGGPDGIVRAADADPVTRVQAQREFSAAARYYREHANRVVLSDNEAYARSLWAAADAYDRAGDQEMAIEAFSEYADGFPADPRRPEARYRLAQAHQARGDYESAAKIYGELIKEDMGDDPDRNLGRWADASYVPLARSFLSDTNPANDEEAERLLKLVASGSVVDTTAEQFRLALLDLGQLYYQSGRYPEAIARFEEAAHRYPDDPDIDEILFKLADSCRLEASAIEETLKGAVPDQQRELEKVRRERLTRAMELFERVRGSLGSADPDRMGSLRRLFLRNANFYIGDCAFALGDYEAAIHHYDTARERYPRDPASLVAMTQIVNAYLALGDPARAQTANERATRFYKSLPAEVWKDPDLPMTKADWERWLDSTTKLLEMSGGEGGGGATADATTSSSG